MITKISNFLLFFLIILCVFYSMSLLSANNLAKQSIPVDTSLRKLGSIELGMTETEFKQAYNQEPEYYHDSVDGITLAEVDIRNFPNMLPSVFYNRKAINEYSIACYFLNEVLYEIRYEPPESNARRLIEAATKRFGKPAGKEDWVNGLTWTQWTTNDATLSICHIRVPSDNYPLNQPVGTAVQIKLTDKQLGDRIMHRKTN